MCECNSGANQVVDRAPHTVSGANQDPDLKQRRYREHPISPQRLLPHMPTACLLGKFSSLRNSRSMLSRSWFSLNLPVEPGSSLMLNCKRTHGRAAMDD